MPRNEWQTAVLDIFFFIRYSLKVVSCEGGMSLCRPCGLQWFPLTLKSESYVAIPCPVWWIWASSVVMLGMGWMKYCLPWDHFSSLLILAICILKDSVLFLQPPSAVGQQVELKMLIELVREGDLSPTALCQGRQPSPRCVFLVPIARESKVRNCEFSGIAYCFIERNEMCGACKRKDAHCNVKTLWLS